MGVIRITPLACMPASIPTAMIGDGAKDILALRSAKLGIAMQPGSPKIAAGRLPTGDVLFNPVNDGIAVSPFHDKASLFRPEVQTALDMARPGLPSYLATRIRRTRGSPNHACCSYAPEALRARQNNKGRGPRAGVGGSPPSRGCSPLQPMPGSR